MKTIVIIDGQGGKMGAALTAQLKQGLPGTKVIAVGTNSVATTAMLKAGADAGATGENPVAVNCARADLIAGPMGIITANALYGEITPKMAAAISESPAQKLLIPVNRCSVTVVGVEDLPLNEYVKLAAQKAKEILFP